MIHTKTTVRMIHDFNPRSSVLSVFLGAILLLTACGGEKKESLADLKAKEADLKSQLAVISTEISRLEGDSGKKSTLVEVTALKPATFKSYINVQGRVDA